MKLVIGGAFQGKENFVKEKFGYKDIDFQNGKVINKFHEITRSYIYNGDNIKDIMNNVLNDNTEVLISDEIGSGIVPTEKLERKWREETGRILCEIAKSCDEVWRVHCGIGVRIK